MLDSQADDPAHSMPPPLLLLSVSDDPESFMGIVHGLSGKSGKDMRAEHSHEVKALMGRQQGRWGSSQILNWIESNLESGRSETYNMESVINQDVNKQYQNDNAPYRERILKKFGSKADGMAPVFIGGASNDSARFLLPKVEGGGLDRLRNRLANTLGLASDLHDPRDGIGSHLTLEESAPHLSLRNFGAFASSHRHLHPSANSHLGEQPTGSQSVLSLNQTQWNQEFIGRVDELKKQFLRKEQLKQSARKDKMAPGKRNFEDLSRQFSQSSVGHVQFRSGLDNAVNSPISNSLKKIAGGFNINLNLRSERVLPKSLSRPGGPTLAENQMSSGALGSGDTVGLQPQKASYLKNIPHLNIAKKAKTAKLSSEEVASYSERYQLPVDLINELQMEFNCYVEMSKSRGDANLQALGGQEQLPDVDEGIPLSQRVHGIPAAQFRHSFQPLKEKHPHVALKILAAVGARIKLDDDGRPLPGGNPKIAFSKYLELQSLLKFFTAAKEDYIDFWLKVSDRHQSIIFNLIFAYSSLIRTACRRYREVSWRRLWSCWLGAATRRTAL